MRRITGGELRIHFGLVLAEAICVPAFVFELSRALGGNTLSWAYVFEWPILGGYGIYMWRQLLRQENGTAKPRAIADESPDEALDAWNAYLAKVHGTNREDGPGAT